MKYSNVVRAISISLFLVKALYCASYPVTSADEQIVTAALYKAMYCASYPVTSADEQTVTAALYHMTMNCPHNCCHVLQSHDHELSTQLLSCITIT